MQRSDLINKTYNWLLPCAYLTQSIRDFISNLQPFYDTFNQNIFPYYRDDIAMDLLPILMIYVSRTQTSGKYYYKYFNVNVDLIIPSNTTHKRSDSMTSSVMNWLDTAFKRPDFQIYVGKHNPGVMDVAGLNYISQNYNFQQLYQKYSAKKSRMEFMVKFDRFIWIDTLINKYGINPANIEMLYQFPILENIETNIILKGNNQKMNVIE